MTGGPAPRGFDFRTGRLIEPAPAPAKRVPNGLVAAAALAIVTVSVMAAGLLWLTVAGDLAAAGRRIADLEHHSQELKLRRAHALAEHASITDPARLEERALELGFRPPDHVEFLSADPAILGRAPDILPHSPLHVLTARERDVTPTQPGADGVVGRLLSAGARPAAALEAERQTGARP
jgi:hypothetical protein